MNNQDTGQKEIITTYSELIGKENFESVTMFKCKFCGHLFKTDNRHLCKFLPALCNCFSCKNYEGIFEVPTNNSAGESQKFIKCRKKENQEISISSLFKIRWNLQCSEHEMIKNYHGKQSFLDRDVWLKTDGLFGDSGQ